MHAAVPNRVRGQTFQKRHCTLLHATGTNIWGGSAGRAQKSALAGKGLPETWARSGNQSFLADASESSVGPQFRAYESVAVTRARFIAAMESRAKALVTAASSMKVKACGAPG